MHILGRYIQHLSGLLLVFVISSLVSPAISRETSSETSSGGVNKHNGHAETLLKRVRSSLVEVSTNLTLVKGEVSGASGFVVGKNNWVVTNVHAIDQTIASPEDFHLKVLDAQGKSLRARAIALDAANDLAVLEIERPLQVEPLMVVSEQPTVGEQIYSIGSPSSQGFVSIPGWLEKVIDKDTYEFRGTIRSGMSGGPVLNDLGQVVGVNRAVFLAEPRHSMLAGVSPLRRLLKRASELPYVDAAALRGDVVLQQKQIAAELAAKLKVDSLSRETMGPFVVPIPIEDCKVMRFTRPEDRFEVFRFQCSEAWDEEAEGHMPESGFQIRHYWLRNPAFNPLQIARVSDYMVGYHRDTNATAKRARSDWSCRYTRVLNRYRLSLDLHVCQRQHSMWPVFQDVRMRAVALIRGRDALVSLLDINGVDHGSAQRMTQVWLDSIEHRKVQRISGSAR